MSKLEFRTYLNQFIEAVMSGRQTASDDALDRLTFEARRMGSGAVDALLEALEHENPRVRHAVLAALGDLGFKAAPGMAKIVSALRDVESSVRGSAAQALGAIGPEAKGSLRALDMALGVEDDPWASAIMLETISMLQVDEPQTGARAH